MMLKVYVFHCDCRSFAPFTVAQVLSRDRYFVAQASACAIFADFLTHRLCRWGHPKKNFSFKHRAKRVSNKQPSKFTQAQSGAQLPDSYHGDGYTIVFVQDIPVFSEYPRKVVGLALLQAILDRFRNVRQIERRQTTPRRPLHFTRRWVSGKCPKSVAAVLFRI